MRMYQQSHFYDENMVNKCDYVIDVGFYFAVGQNNPKKKTTKIQAHFDE